MKSKSFRGLRFFAVLVTVVTLALTILYTTSPNRAEIRLELAKSLAYLLVVLLLGATVTEAIKERDRQRRESEALAVFRNDIRKRLTEAYQAVKRCRCLLRVAGVTTEGLISYGQMNAEALTTYKCQLEEINEIQLDLEKLWQELECFRQAFSSSHAIILRVKVMSGYLRRLIDEYENNCTAFYQETNSQGLPKPSFSQLEQLVHSTKGSKFREKFCDRYSEVVELIRRDLLKPSLTTGP
jgi:hypothetical protein